MSGSSTASGNIGIEKWVRMLFRQSRPRRQAWLIGSLVSAGSVSIACTLTRDDFEPDEVSGLEISSDAPASGMATAMPARDCPGGAVCCTSVSDCESGELCVDGRCAPPCANDEDVSTCEVPLCSGPDCASAGSSCSDGAQNGDEPAVDCGGACPVACLTDSACRVDGDCASQRCVASRCAPASCEDGVRNQDESDIDCGGSCDRRCAEGARCARDEDCASGGLCPAVSQRCGGAVCDGSACGGGPSCSDGRANGGESGVDCGGPNPECARCPDGEACRGAADCTNGACESRTCVSCTDGARNGSETGIDCGGSADCPRCDAGGSCTLDSDCQSGACSDGTCVVISCEDGLQNGAETDTDCGGSAADCPRCGPGSACALDSDCMNQSCNGGLCASCEDGLQNGGESDTDCGGPVASCGRCGAGSSCQVDSDCASGACQDGTCCGGSQSDCTRCAERLSASVHCDFPTAGQDSTGVIICNAFLACLASHIERCPTRNTPGCSGADQLNDACPHNNFGGNAATGPTRVNQILQNAGCQL